MAIILKAYNYLYASGVKMIHPVLEILQFACWKSQGQIVKQYEDQNTISSALHFL